MARKTQEGKSVNGETGSKSAGKGLSTFEGVYTPSILTILGVIMYLRFGWVVGNVGLIGTLAIVTLSTGITFLTALSIAAIATDQRVRIGGAYYMISRSLGIETGGAVGIPLYFAQALSVALYTVGFAESVVQAFPSANEKMVGVVTTIFVTLVALKSARAAIRSQYIIMVAIGISLFSLMFGSPIEDTEIVFWAQPREGNFWVVFAVFFPAVTGIMAGVNMSGDLEDSARSIPRGTLAAVGSGYLIYMLLPILLVFRVGTEALIDDPLVMRKISFWGDAILLGVWGATLSSAVGSILGAPRVLQALSRDGVLPSSLKFLGKGSGPADEPRIGTVVTFFVAIGAVLLGNLNLIAPVLSMFFLTTYGVLNITAGLERFLNNPSYRPVFKVHWALSLLGAIGCVVVMFLINALASVIAIVCVASIYVWLERREIESAWGDVRQGIWMALTREGLLRMKTYTQDTKNWRPHLLVLSGAPRKRWHLIELASAIAHNRALLTVATVIPSDDVSDERMSTMESMISEYLTKRGVQSLVRVIADKEPLKGAERLVQIYGLGALVPNTILLGASETEELKPAYCRMIANFYNGRRNVALVHYNSKRRFGNKKRIDVWWGGLQNNGGLMMILAYLLKTSILWRSSEIRVKMVVPDHEAEQPAYENLSRLVKKVRTDAIAEVLVKNNKTFDEILIASSSDADIIFMGMAQPHDGYVEYFEQTFARIRQLPTTILVLASQELKFSEVLLQQELLTD